MQVRGGPVFFDKFNLLISICFRNGILFATFLGFRTYWQTFPAKWHGVRVHPRGSGSYVLQGQLLH